MEENSPSFSQLTKCELGFVPTWGTWLVLHELVTTKRIGLLGSLVSCFHTGIMATYVSNDHHGDDCWISVILGRSFTVRTYSLHQEHYSYEHQRPLLRHWDDLARAAVLTRRQLEGDTQRWTKNGPKGAEKEIIGWEPQGEDEQLRGFEVDQLENNLKLNMWIFIIGWQTWK